MSTSHFTKNVARHIFQVIPDKLEILTGQEVWGWSLSKGQALKERNMSPPQRQSPLQTLEII